MSEIALTSIDDLSAAAHGIVRQSHNVLQDAHESRELDPFTSRFISDLEKCIKSFDRYFPVLSAKLTKASIVLGDVPFERHGFTTTSGHELARQIGSAVLRNSTDARNNRTEKKVWERSCKALKAIQFEPKWLSARIAAERDLLIDEFHQLHVPEFSHRSDAVRLRRLLSELKAALANNSAGEPFDCCFDLIEKIARATDSYIESDDVFISGWSNSPSRKWGHPFKVTISNLAEPEVFMSVEIYAPDGGLITGYSGRAPFTFYGDGTDLEDDKLECGTDDPMGIGGSLLHAAQVACDRWLAALSGIASEPTKKPNGQSQYAEPMSPKQLVKRFRMSWDALKPKIDDGIIRVMKLSTKSYRVLLEDLPPT